MAHPLETFRCSGLSHPGDPNPGQVWAQSLAGSFGDGVERQLFLPGGDSREASPLRARPQGATLQR